MQRLFLLFVFFYLSAISAQKNGDKVVRLRVNSWKEVDSLIRFNNILNSKIINDNGQILLEGNKINDTLYIYIANQNQIDSLHCHFKTCNSSLNSYQQQRIKKGFLFNKLMPVKLYIENHRLNMVFQYENGSVQKIDSIAYNVRFPGNIENYLLQHHKGKTLNKDHINEIKQFINSQTGYRVHETRVLFKDDQNILVLNLAKSKNNRINGFAGFSFDPDTKKLIVDGELNSKLYNLTHHNETLILRWRKNSTIQNFKLSIMAPFLFSKNIFLQNNLLIERKGAEELNFYNKIATGWHYKKHALSIHYIVDNTLSQQNDKKNLFGADYRYMITQVSGLFGLNELKTSLSFGAKNERMFAGTITHQTKIFNNQYLAGLAYVHENWGMQHSNMLKDFDQNMGNTLLLSNEIQSLQHIKLAYAYKRNTSYYYLLGSYMKTKHLSNSTENYINSGIGIHFSNKNQILTFEFTKSINLSHSTDIQDFKVYIKQQIKF